MPIDEIPITNETTPLAKKANFSYTFVIVKLNFNLIFY